jgi:hypothetical protein
MWIRILAFDTLVSDMGTKQKTDALRFRFLCGLGLGVALAIYIRGEHWLAAIIIFVALTYFVMKTRLIP